MGGRRNKHKKINFGMDIETLVTTPKYAFQFPTIDNINTADKQTCDVGSTPVLLAAGLYNDIRSQIFKNTKLYKSNLLYNVK